MKIKQIEIKGFKSFKHRTVISFGKGISSIVGPNGCGKSNVVDAFLWVMGETSPKYLRSSSMEDIIFKGTTNQIASGVAEVSLVMESEQKNVFPDPYKSFSEIMISRRLDRDGKSDYLINSKICRLKDIQELCMDIGVGIHGFSFIEQGAVERFIFAKPEQKRLLIESAAGISKFRSRKRDAEKKLELTDLNLKRLKDILSQQQDQLQKLKKQSEKAEQFKNLKQQIRDKDIQISLWGFNKIQTEKQSLDTKITTQIKNNEHKQQSITKLDSQLEELTKFEEQKNLQEKSIESNLDSIKSQIVVIDTQIASLKTSVKVNKNDLSHQDFESYKKNGQRLLTQINQNKTSIITLEEQQKTLSKKEELIKQSYTLLDQKIMALSIKKQSLETQLTNCEHQEILVKERAQFMDSQFKEGEQHKKNLENTLIQKNKEFQKNISQKTILSENLDQKKQLNFSVINSAQEVEKDVQAFKKNIQNQEANLTEAQKQESILHSELNSFKQLGSHIDSQKKGIQFVLQSEQNNNTYKETAASFSILSPILEQSVSSYLDSRLKSVFCENKNKALSALYKLYQNKEGRCRFILKDNQQNLTPLKTEIEALTLEPGFKFFLKDKIEGNAELINLLFSYGVVVEDIKTAFDLKQKYSHWYFLTLTGEILTQEGDLLGGEFTKKEINILAYNRALKELPIQCEKQNKKICFIEEQLKKTRMLFKKSLDTLSELTLQKSSSHIHIVSIQKDLEIVNRDYNYLLSEITNIKNNIQKYNKQSQELQKKQEDLKHNFLQNSSQKVIIKELQQIELQYKKDTQEKQILFTQKNQLWGEVTDCEKQLSKVQETQILLKQSLENETKEEKKFFSRFQEKQILIKQDESQLQETQKQHDILYQKIQSTQKQLDICTKQKQESRERIKQEQLNTINLHKTFTETQSYISKLKLQCENLSFKQSALKDKITERYNIELTEVKNVNLGADFNKATEEQYMHKISKTLSYIGEVNLLALKEYEELTKENSFYQKQYEDLCSSKQKLTSVIQRIDSFCSKKFQDVFEQVNACFSKIWPSLFDGGKASLVLVKDAEKNIDGMDIMVQPPDKKTQNMNLLSGGEKAMTAIAVIFSIFLVKPSPFCILDEVDAPLDDMNISRFNSLLLEMSRRSQVIIVTHNKYTMKECNYLYGVTMEEKGISKVMSLNMKSVSSTL